MSVQRQQTQLVMQEIVRRLYSAGKKPLLGDIFTHLSAVFSENPAGRPFYTGTDIVNPDGISDVEQYNRNIANMLFDLNVLYSTSLEQTQELMQLNEALRSYTAQLELKRRRVENRIDDYLLTLYNTDGYFYSVSDTFSDLSFTDLAMTSAYVDNTGGDVLLPSIAGLSSRVTLTEAGEPAITARIAGVANSSLPIRRLSPFANAMEPGLDNVVWAFEVEAPEEVELLVTVDIPMSTANGNVFDISKIIFTPYAIVPFQFFVETRGGITAAATHVSGLTLFGNNVYTTLNKTTILGEVRPVDIVRITMRKKVADYIQTVSGSLRYRYIFGAKEIEMYHEVYDNRATFVSTPISMPTDLGDSLVIDAVSLAVQDETPAGTKLDYYVATDTGAESLHEYDWRMVNPIGRSDAEQQVVRFDGAQKVRRKVKANPNTGELQLIPLSPNNADLNLRNPTPSYLPGDKADAYRLCKFAEKFLAGSLVLEEGVNTVRSYYVPVVSEAAYDIEFWGGEIQRGELAAPVHTRIDGGNDFFYGGDIGQSNIAVYSETYLFSDSEQTTFLSEFVKNDSNSQMWDVDVYLNGRQIGKLPIGVNRLTLPWTFRQGENHIVVMSTIPAGNVNGSVELMAGLNLTDYGRVHLGTWNYVDLFDMRFNEAGEPKTFTIYNDEIISRRRPTDNYEAIYAQGTGKGPEAIRFRADLSRDFNNASVSPKLASYRLRFEYGDQ